MVPASSSLNPLKSPLMSKSVAMGNSATGTCGGREWVQTLFIYGCDDWRNVLLLFFHSLLFAVLSFSILFHFDQCWLYSHSLFPALRPSLLRISLVLLGPFLGISSLCLFLAAVSLLHSSTALRWDVSRRIVASVPDWSSVRAALDVGCGRGFLLNSIAMQLKKQGSRGNVVGLGASRSAPVSALHHRARSEGVEEYVTCREGDPGRMPFPSGYFDVVVSADGLGRAAEGRERGLVEMVRVLRPGGVGVLWDTNCAPQCDRLLREMRMEDVRISERIAVAYLGRSCIVLFRKPLAAAETSEWRMNLYFAK